MTRGVLYIVACAAPPAREVDRLIRAAQEESEWDVCLIATPSAVRFLDKEALENITGHPVRSDYKEPGDPDTLPPPDGIIVAPATVNSINKWALGICDTLALGLLVEAIGKKLPMVALPFTNYAHAAHPAFEQSIAKLRSWGVEVLYGPDIYLLHEPGAGDQHLDVYPWDIALQALNGIMEQRAE